MKPAPPDLAPDPVRMQPEAELRASQPGGAAAADFSDSVGGLFSAPASLLPDMQPEAGEPPARSLFALRGLFRL